MAGLTALKVGDKAPDFSLPSSNDGTVRLSQFLGTNVVIFFYPGNPLPSLVHLKLRNRKEIQSSSQVYPNLHRRNLNSNSALNKYNLIFENSSLG